MVDEDYYINKKYGIKPDGRLGLGRIVRQLRTQHRANAFGYDIINLREWDDEKIFRSNFNTQFDKIYFMHSLAHIPNVKDEIDRTVNEFLKYAGRIVVITPNQKWLNEISRINTNYVPDPTVKTHFTSESLAKLFTDVGMSIIAEGQFGSGINDLNERLFIIAQKK